MVHDYLTFTEVQRIADAAMGESDPVKQLTERVCARGNWTGNLYADIVVSAFISRFYQDFQRRVATDASVLAFSNRFQKVRRPINAQEVQDVFKLQSGANPVNLLSSSFERLGGLGSSTRGNEGSNRPLNLSLPESDDPKVPTYILLVSERVIDGLRLAESIGLRDPVCACEMTEAIVIWYILWARTSLARTVSSASKVGACRSTV